MGSTVTQRENGIVRFKKVSKPREKARKGERDRKKKIISIISLPYQKPILVERFPRRKTLHESLPGLGPSSVLSFLSTLAWIPPQAQVGCSVLGCVIPSPVSNPESQGAEQRRNRVLHAVGHQVQGRPGPEVHVRGWRPGHLWLLQVTGIPGAGGEAASVPSWFLPLSLPMTPWLFWFTGPQTAEV